MQFAGLAAGVRADGTVTGPTTPLIVGGAPATISVYATGLGTPTNAGPLALGSTAPPGASLLVRAPDAYLNGNILPAGSVTLANMAPGVLAAQVTIQLPPDTLPGANTLRLCTNDAGAQYCSNDATIFTTRTGTFLAGSRRLVRIDDDDSTQASLEAVVRNLGGKVTANGNDYPFTIDANGNYSTDLPPNTTSATLRLNGQDKNGTTIVYGWKDNVIINGTTTYAESPVQVFRADNDPTALFDYHPEIKVNAYDYRPELIIWTPSNNPTRLLDYLKYTNNANRSGTPCDLNKLIRWRDEDLPVKTYLNSPQAPSMNAIAADQSRIDVLNQISSHLIGKQIMISVTYDPVEKGESGLRVRWEAPVDAGDNAVAAYHSIDGISCTAPTQGEVYFGPAVWRDMTSQKIIFDHEFLEHAIQGAMFHAGATKYNAYFGPSVLSTPFETRALIVRCQRRSCLRP